MLAQVELDLLRGLDMTPQQVRDAIDAVAAQMWPTVIAKQDAYFAAYGRYFQGLRSHTVTPADGVDAVPDNLSATPYYQAESWQSMGGFPATTKSVVECTQYIGPLGAGWVLMLTVSLAGRLWQRAVGHGPEARDRAWADIG